MASPMVLSVAEVRESEALTMSQEPISSLDLMERAGTRFAETLMRECDLHCFSNVVVLCGTGNNGGDGLVIARCLKRQNLPVKVVLVKESDARCTEGFNVNLQRWKELVGGDYQNLMQNYVVGNHFDFGENTMVIDAIFGIGLSRALTGYFAHLVEDVNAAHCFVVAVDVPSGLFSDAHTPVQNPCLQADLTYTFQFQKLAYLLPENAKRCGRVGIIDIGLQSPIRDVLMQIVENKTIVNLLRRPYKFAHKGSMGHGLLIAGSADMPGAAILSAMSALRGGIGKLTVHAPGKVCDYLPNSIPEAILSRDEDDDSFSGVDLERYPTINAVAVGCGLGRGKTAEKGLKMLLDEVGGPLILDADALNILSENKTWLAFLPAKSILTPHFKEFERLVGHCENDFDRIAKLREFSRKYELIVILKGANTAMAFPDGRLYFNPTGNPGMATAGSGDVLTGLLLALLSQGYAPEAAAMLGVFLHGLAGDIAAAELGHPTALIASDLPRFFGKALMALGHNHFRPTDCRKERV